MDSSKNRLSTSINMFALELYQDLRRDGQNLVVSPFGLQVLLAMTLEGADGKTASEISKALHHAKNDKEILEGYKTTINSLECPSLKIATRMFVENTIEIKERFKSLASEYFLSEISGKDFNKSPEDSRRDINKWAEEKTNHKIKDLLPQGSVGTDSRLVMVNAIYFYGQWETIFDEKNTVDMPFYVTPNKSANVKMMVMRETFLFVECKKLDAKIVKLLYEDETFSMVIVLPNKLNGLPDIENKLKSTDLSKELSTHHHTVNLMLPKFRIEKTMDLSGSLSQRMPSAFTGKADLSGMSDGPLNISKVMQKAFIEVNETGTEATATTAIITMYRSKPVPKIVHDMKCDHPFFFQILKDDLILFQGALTEPDSEKLSKILDPSANKSDQ